MTILEQLFNELESGHFRINSMLKEKYLVMEREFIKAKKIELGITVDSNTPSASDVMVIVSNITGVSSDLIRSKKRDSNYTFARQLFCYFVMNYCSLNTSECGAYIMRDHSTVIHSVNKVKDLIIYGSNFQKDCISKGIDFFERIKPLPR